MLACRRHFESGRRLENLPFSREDARRHRSCVTAVQPDIETLVDERPHEVGDSHSLLTEKTPIRRGVDAVVTAAWAWRRNGEEVRRSGAARSLEGDDGFERVAQRRSADDSRADGAGEADGRSDCSQKPLTDAGNSRSKPGARITKGLAQGELETHQVHVVSETHGEPPPLWPKRHEPVVARELVATLAKPEIHLGLEELPSLKVFRRAKHPATPRIAAPVLVLLETQKQAR